MTYKNPEHKRQWEREHRLSAGRYGILDAPRPGARWTTSRMPTALFYRVFRKTLPAVRGRTCPPSNGIASLRKGTGLARPSALANMPTPEPVEKLAWGVPRRPLREVRADRIVLGSKMDVKVTYQKHGPRLECSIAPAA